MCQIWWNILKYEKYEIQKSSFYIWLVFYFIYNEESMIRYIIPYPWFLLENIVCFQILLQPNTLFLQFRCKKGLPYPPAIYKKHFIRIYFFNLGFSTLYNLQLIQFTNYLPYEGMSNPPRHLHPQPCWWSSLKLTWF